MCVSTLHRVVGPAPGNRLEVEDLEGTRRQLSLLAFEGPAPAPGRWVVCHSGYVLAPADGADADAARAELDRLSPETSTTGS
jgi:hydrogenase maturation factor